MPDATEIDVKFEVDKEVLEQILRNLPEAIGTFMDKEAETVVNDIKLSFGTSPAPPNNPPGVDLDNLRDSMDWTPDGDYRRYIHDGVEYGVYLELGNTRHNYVWPFMGPAIERENKVFAEHARDEGLIK